MQNQEDRVRYAAKGSSITHAGYESGIHALPQKVKEKLDSYLKYRYSPARTLAQLSHEFPSVSLPSKSALYNYRKRYFEQSIVSSTSVAKIEELLDVDKIKLKSVLLTQIKRFVAFDLPTLRERWIKAQENDEQLLLPQTKDIGKMYMEAMKLSIEAVPKLNIEMTDEAELETDQNTAKELDARKDDLDAKLARIMAKRIVQYSIRSITETNIGNQPIAT